MATCKSTVELNGSCGGKEYQDSSVVVRHVAKKLQSAYPIKRHVISLPCVTLKLTVMLYHSTYLCLYSPSSTDII